ncbi:MAG: hypothetical protein ABIM88_07260 [candidate division WOR-3 bacterium]
MKRFAIISSLAIAGTGCGLFYHKEVVEVPNPAVLTDPEIAKEASGARLVYQDIATAKTEKGKFLGAEGSAVRVLSHGTETEINPSQMTNARLEMSASKMTPLTCLGSTCLGVGLGGFLGYLVGKDIYEDAIGEGPGEEPTNCIEILIWPLIVLMALAIAIVFGVVVAGLVLLLSLIFGNVILPNLFLNSKVREIKARARRLRNLIAMKPGG